MNTALPVHGPVPEMKYLAQLCIDLATDYSSKKSGYKTICTGNASLEAQLRD